MSEPEDKPSSKVNVDGIVSVVVAGCIVLFSVFALAGLIPPKHVRRVAGMWGIGIGMLTFIGLILAGWRMGEWFWYPIQFLLMIVAAALGATVMAGLYIALFDPPPTQEEQDVRFREIMNIR